ncbi:MAG: flagellar basal body P-ring formation chaperone FlgA [Planctomycetota bacterium]|jgi:flagella basal body P-ring formation protein FlgA
MPRPIQLALAVLLAVAGSGPVARAAEGPFRITLKEAAVVSDSEIALGDVALLGEDVPAEVAQLLLGNAPWPGQAREVTRVLLKTRLAAAGFALDGFQFAGEDACWVKRDSVRVEAQEIVEAARRILMEQFPEKGPEVQMELLQEVGPVLLPAGDEPVILRASLPGTAAPLGTVRVDVDLVRDGGRLKRVPLRFSVRVREQVAVAARKIGAGERFTAANVRLLRRDTTPLGGACVRTREDLAGKVAARALRPGQIITDRMVAEAERPLVIGVNQRVFLVVRTPTLRITTLGKSLERARQGQIARAKNLSTGREVVGIALDDSTIQVLLEGQSHGD